MGKGSYSLKNATFYIILIGAILVYSLTGVCTRHAAAYDFLSCQYILWVFGAIGMLGVYAIIWQQIIQRIPISTAYMFRGLGLVFSLCFCYCLFNEQITMHNIIGAIIIIAGITLFALSDQINSQHS